MNDKNRKNLIGQSGIPAEEPLENRNQGVVSRDGSAAVSPGGSDDTISQMQKEIEALRQVVEEAAVRNNMLAGIIDAGDADEIRRIMWDGAYELAVRFDGYRKRERAKTVKRDRPKQQIVRLFNIAVSDDFNIMTEAEKAEFNVRDWEEDGVKKRSFSYQDGRYLIIKTYGAVEEEVKRIQEHYDKSDSSDSNYSKHKASLRVIEIIDENGYVPKPGGGKVKKRGMPADMLDGRTRFEELAKYCIAKCFVKAELAGIKETVMRGFAGAEVQGLRYYLHRYEKMKNADIEDWYAEKHPNQKVTRQAISNSLKKAVPVAIDRGLDKLCAPAELRAWYERSIKEHTFYTLPDGTDPKSFLEEAEKQLLISSDQKGG